jgi:hypothetical protein
MSISIIDVQSVGGSFTVALPAFASPAAGDCIVVACAEYNNATPSTPTDNFGNTYVLIGTTHHAGAAGLAVWIASGIAATGPLTVTCPTGAQWTACVGWLIRGAGSSPYNGDWTVADWIAGGTPTVGPTSPAPAANSLMLAFANVAGATAIGEQSGWNTTGVNGFTSTMSTAAKRGDWASNNDIWSMYKITSAVETPTWPTSTGVAWVAIALSLAPDTGGPSAAAGSASGTSSASATGASLLPTTGTSSGTSTASAEGFSAVTVSAGAGSAEGTSSADASGLSIGVAAASGSAGGGATGSATGLSLFTAAGLAAGLAIGLAVGAASGTQAAVGSAEGTSSVLGVSSVTPRRLYFPTSGTPPIFPAYSTDWTTTSFGSRSTGQFDNVGSSSSFPSATSSSSSPQLHLVRQYVYPALLAQTITGTVKGQIRAKTTGGFQGTVVLGIRVFSADGLTLRGTLLAPTASSASTVPPRLSTAFTNRPFLDGSDSPSIALTPVTCLYSDILVVELGVRSNDPTPGGTGSVTTTTSFSGVDLPEDSTTISNQNPWIEFPLGVLFSTLVESLGTSHGLSTVLGTSQLIHTGVGSAAGISVVEGDGPGLLHIVGSAAGTSDASAVGFAAGVHAAVGSITGTSDASGVSENVALGLAEAEGLSTVEAVGFTLPPRFLAPEIDDDSWGGPLTFLWTQVSGPDVVDILNPADSATDVDFPTTGGAYIFRLTVSRAFDALVGTIDIRVFVVSSVVVDPTIPVYGVSLVSAPSDYVLLSNQQAAKNLRGYTNSGQYSNGLTFPTSGWVGYAGTAYLPEGRWPAPGGNTVYFASPDVAARLSGVLDAVSTYGPGPVTVTANGAPLNVKVNSSSISQSLGQAASCSFSMVDNPPAEPPEEVIFPDSPTSAPVLSSAPTTDSTESFTPGTYWVVVTFVYSDGRESLPGPSSNSVAFGGSEDFLVTNIPAAPSGVTARRVYLHFGSWVGLAQFFGSEDSWTGNMRTRWTGKNQPPGIPLAPVGQAAILDVGNEVVLERDGVRLFGGICLSVTITYDEGVPTYNPSVAGYAWHLGRIHITKTYTDWGIDAIARDILNLVPGGLQYAGIYGLPPVTIAFTDATAADALAQLTKLHQGLHFDVDFFKRLHFAVIESSGDPEPLTINHKSMRNLSLTKSINGTVNRVRVYYTIPGSGGSGSNSGVVGWRQEFDTFSPDTNEVIPAGDNDGDPPFGSSVIRVGSLQGYATIPDVGSSTGFAGRNGGGTINVNGHLVTYGSWFDDWINPITYRILISSVNLKALADSTGQLPTGSYQYFLTGVTSDGESSMIGASSKIDVGQRLPIYAEITRNVTTVVDPIAEIYRTDVVTSQGPLLGYTEPTTAVEIWILGVQGPTQAIKRLTGINVYRISVEDRRNGDIPHDPTRDNYAWFVGSVGPRGGMFVDKVSRANLAPNLGIPSGRGNADVLGHFLSNCQWQGNATDVGSADAPPTFVDVNDSQAQSNMSSLLGGGSGVIEAAPIQGGEISMWDAYSLGQAFLRQQSGPQSSVTVSVKDQQAQPGAILDVSMPEPIGREHLKIQQVGVTGFELGVAHEETITAATIITTLDDLLRAAAHKA